MQSRANPVLLVSDVAGSFDELDLSRTDLEMTDQETIDGIRHGIEACGYDCRHVDDPKSLPGIFSDNPDCLVLSIWSGQGNRNRRAIVPSICEAHNIRYVGADPYAAMISSDKNLSKTVCAEFGLNSPSGVLVRSSDQADLINGLDFPVVAKPLLEGGSIGVTQGSKAPDLATAKTRIDELFKYYQPPILCEQFIGGREISFCMVGAGKIAHIEAMEIKIDGEPDYFNDRVFSMHDKRSKCRQEKHRFVNVTDEMPDTLIHKIRRVYQALGKVDYMRIDGKYDGEFYCLELSTDPGIGINSLFAHSYYSIGRTYRDMIAGILATRMPDGHRKDRG